MCRLPVGLLNTFPAAVKNLLQQIERLKRPDGPKSLSSTDRRPCFLTETRRSSRSSKRRRRRRVSAVTCIREQQVRRPKLPEVDQTRRRKRLNKRLEQKCRRGRKSLYCPGGGRSFCSKRASRWRTNSRWRCALLLDH